MKIISFFNHKGGVSKTTTVFNLGWKLARLGKKVLIVDADPQCNLTSLVLGYDNSIDIKLVYQQYPNCDIYTGLDPVFQGNGNFVVAEPYQTANNNLYLLCGNLRIAEIETQLSVALTTSSSITAIKNLPGSVGCFIRETGRKLEVDYILIDMSPSIGALNECLFMNSDCFIIPTSPDFFCDEAIKSLARTFPRWNKEVTSFRNPNEMNYSINMEPPKFIGFISQRYRPRNGTPAKSFQHWIDIIRDSVNSILLPILKQLKMDIPLSVFTSYVSTSEPFNFISISDFNSLVAQSQKYGVPVFELTKVQMEQTGTVYNNMENSRLEFDKLFDKFGNNFINLLANI